MSAYHNATSEGQTAEFITNSRVMETPLGQMQVKRVCRSCNSGWMSQIEHAAKAPLTRLIKGNTMALSAADQQAVATWFSLFIVMHEFVTPKTNWAIPGEYQKHLFVQRKPLPNMLIQAVPHIVSPSPVRGWGNAVRHIVTTIGQDNGSEGVRVPQNTWESTLGIGCVVLHGFGTAVPDRVPWLDWWMGEQYSKSLGRLAPIRRIWPRPLAQLKWPPHGQPFDDEAVWVLSSMFMEQTHDAFHEGRQTEQGNLIRRAFGHRPPPEGS
jgi:hypothetical protein